MNETRPTGTELREPRGWLAALLSLVVSGLGQFYVERWKTALLLMVVPQLLYPLMALLIFLDVFDVWLFAACMAAGIAVQISGAVHAFVTARRTPPFLPRRWSRWYGLLGIVLLCVAIVAVTAVAYEDPTKSFYIPANSMQPNVPEGDRLVAVGLYGKSVERGEIVLFRQRDQDTDFIKRVVAVAGDSVELRDNRLFVNDREVSGGTEGSMRIGRVEYELVSEAAGERRYNVLVMRGSNLRGGTFARRIVPYGHVFVLGDNRDNSYDSRFFGPVKVEDVHWRAAFVFWSLDRGRIGIDLRRK